MISALHRPTHLDFLAGILKPAWEKCGSRLLAIALVLVCFAVPNCFPASPPSANEVQAAFLFNFSKFVEWPDYAFESSKEKLIICILGEDPFGFLLDRTVEGKRAGTRFPTVRRLDPGSSVDHCHILFISTSEQSHLESVLQPIHLHPILTVSDIPRFASSGGMIGFFFEDNRVRFEINQEATQTAGLIVSSRLLQVGRPVSSSNRGGRP